MSDAAPDVTQLREFRGRDPRVDTLWQRMEAWQELLAKQAAQLSDALAGIQELRRQLAEGPADAAEAVRDVLADVDGRFTALTRALTPVLDGLGERVHALEDAPPPTIPDLAGLRRQFDSMDAALGDVRRILGEHGGRLDRRATDIQTLATAIRKVAAHVDYKGSLNG